MSLRLALILPLAIALSGCATPAVRLYSEAELSVVSRTCRVAEGEVLQEEEEPRLLFLFSPGASPAQRKCVERWSRRHGLHLAFVEAVDRAPE